MSERKTIFSPCRVYRYTLWREWGVGSLPLLELAHRKETSSYVQFIGLNPSTADEVQDDPTVRRCIAFAKRWGYGAMCMTNLFALRATDPNEMKQHPFPIGARVGQYSENDHWLSTIAQNADLVIAAWGKDGRHLWRDADVLRFLNRVHCLGKNSDGTPKHPLYLKADLVPMSL